MKNWIKKIKEADFLKKATIEKKTISIFSTKKLVQNTPGSFLYQNDLIDNLGKEITIGIYEDSDYQENILIGHNEIYLRSFFYKTLTAKTKEELITFIFYHQIVKDPAFNDLLIDLNGLLNDFLKSRQQILNSEEFHFLYEEISKEHLISILGLIFVSLMHYKTFDQKLNLIEKKNLKEIFFAKKMKKLLGLEDDAFEYIYEKNDFKKPPKAVIENYTKIKEVIENKKISFMEYIHRTILQKKILFWGIWTISPFLALDISIFLNLLSQSKNLKRIYIDLPISSEIILKKIIAEEKFSQQEDAVEREIKKLYPNFVEDYAKETLPYFALLEKIKIFNIPFFLNGFSGEEIPYKVPQVINKELVFENEQDWEESISLEIKNLDKISDQELVIFFFFLKPMHFLPPSIQKNSKVEKLIHGDPFLGYGPKKAENSIATYSQYNTDKSYSFIIENIDKLYFKDEIINHYPQSKFLIYPLKNSHFNQFGLFDSLMYSNFKGGGGFDEKRTPFIPTKDKIRV